MLRGRDACIRLIRLIRLIFDGGGAPVFALTGYAVASLGIPRGFAVPQCGMTRAKIYRLGGYCSSAPQQQLS